MGGIDEDLPRSDTSIPRLRASFFSTLVADEEAKDRAVVELDGEAACGKEGRVENRSNRKTIRPRFRPEQRKIHMGTDRPGPTRSEIDRTIPIQKGPTRSKSIGRARLGEMRMQMKANRAEKRSVETNPDIG